MKKSLSLALLLTLVFQAHADTIGIQAGAGVWQPDIEGSFGITEVITVEELGLKGEDANYFYLAIEHPVPVLPNIRVTRTDLEAKGSAVLSESFTFDEVEFPAGTATTTMMDLSHTDYTLYYEILDNVASADLGVTFRQFDGSGAIEGTNGSETYSESDDFKATAPMLYGRLQFDLPLSGFYLGGTINYVGLDGDKLSDIEARVGYTTSALVANLGVELGYRKTTIQVDDDDDLQTDMNFDGSYAAVVFHF